MPYPLALVLALAVWWWLFLKIGSLLQTFGADWANMALTQDPAARRRAAAFVMAKHVAFVVLALVVVSQIAGAYPQYRGWTYGVGIIWCLAVFPVGVPASLLILWWWL
jgi:hypothetical protein